MVDRFLRLSLLLPTLATLLGSERGKWRAGCAAPIQAKSITRKTTAQINQVSKNLDIGFLRFRFG